MPVAIDTFCLTCGCVTVFEQPPCTEKKHDGNCPEWICKRCGAAVLIGAWPPAPVAVRRRARVTAAA